MTWILKLAPNQRAATAIEYSLVAALIAIAAIGAMKGLGSEVNNMFGTVNNKL